MVVWDIMDTVMDWEGIMDTPDITVDWLEDTLDTPTTMDGLMDLTMVWAHICWEREKLKRRPLSPRLLLESPDTNIPLVSSTGFPTPKDGLMVPITELEVSLLLPWPPSLLMLILSITVMAFLTGDNFKLDHCSIIAKSSRNNYIQRITHYVSM